jgi:Ankyrin repeats (3 copies)/Sel1 repeat/Ankyrin repeat
MNSTRRCSLRFVWLIGWLLGAGSGGAAGTDVFEAVRAGDGEKVKALVQADPKLAAAKTEDGSTALHLAALEGHADIARLLLASGAAVNARGLREETPLHMAMYDARREVAEVLLANQADVNAQNAQGETPLHLAARKGHRELVVLLLDHGADVNAKDREEATPLHAAVAAGHQEVVEVLLSSHADLLALDKSGRTPKDLAVEKGQTQLVEVLTPRVGDFYNLQRVVFEGAKTFSDKALREALKGGIGFAEAAHPLAPLEGLLERIQRKLLIGYQHHGFPEARVSARHDAKSGRIVVTVVEGPRYLCGEVKVSGAQKADIAGIIDRLTVTRPAAVAAQQAFEFKDKAPGLNPLLPPPGDESKPDEAPWIKGEGAPFSDFDAYWMRERVNEALLAQGFLVAKAKVLVVPDKAARTAQLQVEVMTEGPRAVLERIELSGNKKNSRQAVLDYLELKPGTELTGKVLDRVQERLWRAARFLTNGVSLGAPDADGKVALQVRLAEYDEAPPLGQEFSPSEQAMLKLRDWLAKMNQSGDELVASVSGAAGVCPDFEAVISPGRGLLVLGKAAGADGGKDEYGLAFQPGLAGFYAPISGHKVVLPAPNAQLLIALTLQGQIPEADQSPCSISFNAGFKTKPDDVPNPPAYRFELALPPVVCIVLAHRWDCATWFDHDLLIRSNATVLMKVNARTGRLAQFRYNDETNRAIELHCESSAFEPALRRIEAAASPLADIADTNAPFSSAIAFLLEETFSSKYVEPYIRTNAALGKFARLPSLLHKVQLERVLAPLNRLRDDTNGPGHSKAEFEIPIDPEAFRPTTANLIAVCADWVLRKSDDLLAPRSWPWTLLREACFVVQGKGRYVQESVRQAYNSPDTGPLGCLALAQLLGRFQPPLAREAAARGLERLTAADLRRDCRLLLTGDSILSQCCQALVEGLRDMEDAQVEAVVKEQSPATAQFIRESVKRLRANRQQPAFEALGPILDALWAQGLKEQVTAALQAHVIDPGTAYKDGLAAYQNSLLSKTEAAKLFKQAASQGHLGAQYFLAMMYERGEGVPKNMATALAYYTQSATNGYDEAAATLGNIYSDGLAVKQDYAEAYVWFSVAAARHHRLAAALRNGAQRKLSEADVAAAKQRVAAILAAIPAGKDASPPPSSDP